MHKKVNYWEFLSRIWNFIRAEDRLFWESLWDSINAIAFDMTNKAKRFIKAVNPLKTEVDSFDYMYQIKIDPLKSMVESINIGNTNDAMPMWNAKVVLNTPTPDDEGKIIRSDSISIDKSVVSATR